MSQGDLHAFKQWYLFAMNVENKDVAHTVCSIVPHVTTPLHVRVVNVDCGYMREYTTRNVPIVSDEKIGPEFVYGRLDRIGLQNGWTLCNY